MAEARRIHRRERDRRAVAPGLPRPASNQIHSTNPLERLNKEVKRRPDVVGIFPNEGVIIRLIGAVLLEANDEWQLQHRYMQTEPMPNLHRR
jgi:putative transposase